MYIYKHNFPHEKGNVTQVSPHDQQTTKVNGQDAFIATTKSACHRMRRWKHLGPSHPNNYILRPYRWWTVMQSPCHLRCFSQNVVQMVESPTNQIELDLSDECYPIQKQNIFEKKV